MIGECNRCEDGFIIKPRHDLIEGRVLFEAYTWLKNYNQFPVSGTWLQQPAKFINALKLIDSVHNVMAQKQKEINEANKALVALKGRSHGQR